MSSATGGDQLNFDNSTSTFVSALWFNAVLAVGFFGAFIILRPHRPQTYAPRLYAVSKDKRPPPLSKGYFRWLIELFRIPDQDLIKTMGLDRFMVLKLLRMGMVTFSLYSIVAIPVLFPIITIRQGNQPGLTAFTMANIIDDHRTWGNCLLACILTCLVWYYTFRETKIYINLRRKYLLSPDYASTIAARTLYVPSIPKDVNNADDLEKIFDKFPGGVRRIWLNRHLGDLPDLVQERQQTALSLEAAITKAILAVYKANLKKTDRNQIVEEGLPVAEIPEKTRPMHRENPVKIPYLPLPFIGHKVDSIQFYLKKIQKLNQDIQDQQSAAIDLRQVNSAFIEFNQQIAAHMASQTLMHNRAMQMAPRYVNIAPSDVIWDNMNIRSFERMIRRFISMSITGAIVIFWAVPVIFVQAIANLQTLSQVIPFLNSFNQWSPTAVGIIQGILPAVALAILISLVPIIFTILSTKEGIPQRSFVELSVLHKFFFFQLIDVVLVSTLSGGFMTIVSQLQDLAKNPLGVIDILSDNLPKASTFFITFVMLQATNQSGQAMLQLIPYLISYVSPIFSTTPRDLYNSKRKCPSVNLGTLIPAQTVIFILGLEYGVIAPLILPFVCLFFVLQYFVYLYQFVYVYENDYETAGRHFPRAIRHIYIGLLISQLTLIGLFGIRSGARGQMALMIVAFILTIFTLYYYDCAFKPLFKYLPVSSFEYADTALKHKKNDEIYLDDDVYEDDDKPSTISEDPQQQKTMDDENDDDKTNNSDSHKSGSRFHVTEFSKLATNNSYQSRTHIEAYQARTQLLDRLKETQHKPAEEIRKEQKHIINAAKSLYESEAYMHPSTYAYAPTIWIPEDDLGIAQKEIKEMKQNYGVDGTSRGAAVIRKENGKGSVTIDKERLIIEDEGAPGSHPSALRRSHVNDYVRNVVDNFNFFDSIAMY